MQLHEIQRVHKNKTAKQVGRGGKRGKTSGRGHKGQKARAGAKIRPEVRDVIKRIPKLRGQSASGSLNSYKAKPFVLNVSQLGELFSKGEVVSPKSVFEKGLIPTRGGMLQNVKILGNGEITTALTIEGCSISKVAAEKIEKAGGKIVA